MDILIGADGQSIDCHCVAGNHWFAVSHWTIEEAEHYVKTGEYPKRLLEMIRLTASPQSTISEVTRP